MVKLSGHEASWLCSLAQCRHSDTIRENYDQFIADETVTPLVKKIGGAILGYITESENNTSEDRRAIDTAKAIIYSEDKKLEDYRKEREALIRYHRARLDNLEGRVK